MSESPAKVQPNPGVRRKFVQSGESYPRTFGHSDSDNGPESLAIDLIAASVRAKLAAELGAPRLAVRAARQAGEIADRLTIALSPVVAATPAEVETERLGDVTGTADLLALLRPEPDDLDDEREDTR